jgi:release factor glutamine methyltransferase
MTQEQWPVLKVLQWTTDYFREKGMINPRLEAEVLLAHLLGVDRVGLYLNYDKRLKEGERKAYREMIQRRTAREPIAYILGEKEFWSLRFKVNPDCLIPRPETEHLVDEAVRIGTHLRPPRRILEIGTGCGAVAIVLAKELEDANIVAIDISPFALIVAKLNAELHEVAEEITFIQGDLLNLEETQFSLIVSNPPYIPTEEILKLAPEVRDYEPLIALDGGEDGMHFFQEIAHGAPAYLVQKGWLILEMGKGQSQKVTGILEDEGFINIAMVPDYAGIKRVIRAQRA